MPGPNFCPEALYLEAKELMVLKGHNGGRAPVTKASGSMERSRLHCPEKAERCCLPGQKVMPMAPLAGAPPQAPPGALVRVSSALLPALRAHTRSTRSSRSRSRVECAPTTRAQDAAVQVPGSGSARRLIPLRNLQHLQSAASPRLPQNYAHLSSGSICRMARCVRGKCLKSRG